MNIPWRAVYLVVGLLIGIVIGITASPLLISPASPTNAQQEPMPVLPSCAKANYVVVSISIYNLTLLPRMNSDWTPFSIYTIDGLKNYDYNNQPSSVVGYYAEGMQISVSGNGTVDLYAPTRLLWHLNLTDGQNPLVGALNYEETPSFRFFNPNDLPIQFSFTIRIDRGEVFYQSPWPCSLAMQAASYGKNPSSERDARNV